MLFADPTRKYLFEAQALEIRGKSCLAIETVVALTVIEWNIYTIRQGRLDHVEVQNSIYSALISRQFASCMHA